MEDIIKIITPDECDILNTFIELDQNYCPLTKSYGLLAINTECSNEECKCYVQDMQPVGLGYCSSKKIINQYLESKKK